MATLLIIGGTGFFGKCFINYYNRSAFHKWGIDKFIITSRKPLEKFMDIDCVQFNPGENQNLPDADYIIYAASSSDASVYEKDAKQQLDEQNKAIDNFGNILKKQKFKKILYTSSGAIYGNQNLLLNKTDELKTIINPSDNHYPKNIYSQIKANWESFFLDNYKSKSVIARCFAFVGEYLPLDKHFAIGNFINDVLIKKDIEVKAESAVFRSYMFSDDLVEWLLTILTQSYQSSQHGNIFNVGSDESIEIHELANRISIIARNQQLNFSFNHDEIDRYVPNIQLAKNTFDLEIKNQLDESIIRTLGFHGLRC